MIARLLFLFALLLPLPAAAEDLEGTWAFTIDQTAIFRFRVDKDADGWRGVWERPVSFTSNGVIFRAVTGPSVEITSSASRSVGEWTEFRFDDPRPGAVPDVFLLRALEDGTAEAIYSGTGFAPFELRRVMAAEPVGPWDPAATYQRAGLDLAAAGLPVQFTISGAAAERPSPRIVPTPVLERPALADSPAPLIVAPAPLRQPAMIGR